MTNQIEPAETSFVRLVPARIDLSTDLTQLTLASIVACVAALTMYAPTASVHLYSDAQLMHKIGTSLHQSNIGTAMNGWAEAMHMSPNMHADRGPLGILSLLVDRHILRLSEHGLHWGNIALQAICALFVVQITHQLSVSQKRSGILSAAAAAWAGMFYALFPASVGQLVDIGGRGDMLANAFMLASIYLYLRFRALRQTGCFRLSLLCCALALLSATHAMIIPLVITCAEWLLFKQSRPPVQRSIFVLSYWMILFFVATVSIAIPGYQPLNFTLVSSISPLGIGKPETAIFVCYGLALLLMLWRLFTREESWRPFAWCAIWLISGTMLDRIAVPSMQLHAYDKVAWAPMAVGIALCLVPALGNVRKSSARMQLLGATAIAIVICTLFGYMSLQDIRLWRVPNPYQTHPEG